jgi:hypothetical protein
MKLMHTTTGRKVIIGDTLTSFRGEKYTLKGTRPPHKPGSSGHVEVRLEGADWSREFYPGVFDCEFVE